ncbi:MAG TPA: cytochrome c nitrite reductase small subunit [Thermoguttaceae bacterium]|nr:cytochrome c nitrite reductase small subunit [Thermoguttaceae bacterium]
MPSRRTLTDAIARTVSIALSLAFVPRAWRPFGFLALGAAAGAALFVGYVSRAHSYLGNSPETCVNCHIMAPQYATWQHSSHAECATCNDCHVPHDSFVSQYAYKARDGLWHATVFTMHWEPQVIRLSKKAVPVVQGNCRRCHERTVEGVCQATEPGDLRCWDCHRDVPHGSVRSLSATPDVFRPRLRGIEKATDAPLVGGRRSGLDKETP